MPKCIEDTRVEDTRIKDTQIRDIYTRDIYVIVKETLSSDVDKLCDLLDYVGFADVKKHRGEIRCGLDENSNYTSVQVYTDTLYCNIWSRGDYDDYEIKDIITLVGYIKKLSNKKACNLIADYLGISEAVEKGEIVVYEKSKAISKIKRFKKPSTANELEVENQLVAESSLKKYQFVTCEEWEAEGIHADAQREFEVHMDVSSKRWCFTLRDKKGRLIGRKGRTWIKDYKDLKIPKYMYFVNKGTPNHLYNYHRALPHAKEKGELIIVESEKSVMKLWCMGVKNVVAIGNKKISPLIAREILSMGIPNLVFALDKDVGEDEVRRVVSRFRSFKNVWAVVDGFNMLEDKDSPCDRGWETWNELYDLRRKM